MTFTRTIALEQTGVSLAGIWTETPVGDFITVPLGGIIGLVYSVQLTGGSPFRMTTETVPKALDPPIWAQTGTLTFNAHGLLGGDMSIYLVPDPSPELFSSSNPPAVTNVLLLQRTVVASLLGVNTDVNFTMSSDDLIRSYVTSSVYWTGRIGMVLDWQIGGASQLGVSSLVETTLQPFFGGMAGGPYGGPVRSLRDGRFAMPAWSGKLVRDGDQPNLWVRPFDADPDDPEQEYRPRPGEGTVNDDVPNP